MKKRPNPSITRALRDEAAQRPLCQTLSLQSSTIQLFAKTVSAVASGDYYQVVLDSEEIDEDELDPFGQPSPYLMLQRQFEFFDGGKCYVESDDAEYTGHFELQLVEFTPTHLAFEIARLNESDHVEVCFGLTAAEFEKALPIVEVIFGTREPDIEIDDVDSSLCPKH